MRKFVKNVNQKGTSLIEVLLYIGLLSVVLIVIIDLLITSGSLKQEANGKSSLAQDAHYISQRLTYEIERADSVTSPATIGQISQILNTTVGSESYTFSLNAGNLEMQKMVGLSVLTANLNSSLTSVSNLSVQRLGNISGKSSFKINFTLTNLKSTQQGTLSKNYEVVATLR